MPWRYPPALAAAFVVALLLSACVGTSSSAPDDGGAVLVTAPPNGSVRGEAREILTLGELSEHGRVPGPVRELLAEKAVSLPEARAQYDSQEQAPSGDVMGVVRYFVLLPDPQSGEYHFDLVDGDRLAVELMLANASLADLELTLMCVVDLVRPIDCGSATVELASGTGTIVALEFGGIDDGARIDVFVISSGDVERIFPASGHVRVFAGGDPEDERAHLRAVGQGSAESMLSCADTMAD